MNKGSLEVIEPIKKVKFEEDPMISIIVPVYDILPMVLKRCLMSLTSQDYVNKEIICVFDGPNEELMPIAEHFLGYENVQIMTIEHAGACAARNAGFKASHGEIVSFFNSDYIAKPGTIRLWVDALKNNRDCGFAYGGYEYNSQTRIPYYSKPFDAWQLDVANYIDCGFPLWRKYVVEWDTNCKSLQDWDFWIRVVKTHNIKGFYLGRDLTFVAELPRPKGLSDDSSHNWIDRVNYIKNKNGIPLREVLVASTGASNHAIQIAKMIGADYRDDTFDKPHEYKALYNIGFYIHPMERRMNENSRRLIVFKDHYPKAKRIVHFVGADIYWLRKFPYESLKYLIGALKVSATNILSENQEAHDELLEFGLETEIVPIPSYTKDWEIKPLPKGFSVGIYLVQPGHGQGESDFDKYVYEATLSIVRGMPDVQFTGYGYGGTDLRYPNLKHMGLIPRDKWPEYVYSQSALLRLCRHDHHPMASNEFIMAGRDVITNIPTLGAHLIETKGKRELNELDNISEGFNVQNWPETKARVIRAIRNVKKNPFTDNTEITKTLKDALSQEKYIQKINELCGIKGDSNAA